MAFLKDKITYPIHLIIGTFLIILSAACTASPEHLWLKATDWSRGKRIITTPLRSAASIAVDENNQVFLFTTQQKNGHNYPCLLAVNRQGNIIWELPLDLPLETLAASRVISTGQQLVVIWLDQFTLYTAVVDVEGKLVIPPASHTVDIKVEAFDAFAANNGNIEIWMGGSRRQPGIYRLVLNASGSSLTLMAPDGISPAVNVDSGGHVHAAWFTFPSAQKDPVLNYTLYPGNTKTLQPQTAAKQLTIRNDSVINGPWIGLENSLAYIFWGEEIRSGRQMGQTNIKYFTVVPNSPLKVSESLMVEVPTAQHLIYTQPATNTAFADTPVLVEANEPHLVSPLEISVPKTASDKLSIAVRMMLPYKRSTTTQVGTLSFHNGMPEEYQLLSFSSRSSKAAFISSDKSGHFYLTWIESNQNKGYDLYFASSAPDMQVNFSKLTSGDIVQMATETIFGLLQGAVFFPMIGIVWFVPPGIILLFTWIFRRGRESLNNTPSMLSIILAISAFWLSKLTTFAAAKSYVPFAAWIPVIPPWLNFPLQVLIPILGVIIAFLAAWRHTRKNFSTSAALFVLIYCGVDSLITMAVYGEFLFNTTG